MKPRKRPRTDATRLRPKILACRPRWPRGLLIKDKNQSIVLHRSSVLPEVDKGMCVLG